jgi:ribA/ribD-fused uncharacterized protein
MFFGDKETANKIMQPGLHPADHKALGRQVKGFNKEEWDKVSFQIVYEANLAKFSQHQDLKNMLLSLEDKILVEASPTDRIWGIGLDEADPRIENPINWRGQNLLGWAITLVKQELKNDL